MITNDKIVKKAKKIKLVITDIDGVWTDAKMYYTKDGSFMKSFSTYDGMGSHLLLKNNFIVAMITSEYENIDILMKRAKKLNIKEVYTNEKNKLDRVKYLMKKYELKKDNIAYIGDDLNDLDALKGSDITVALITGWDIDSGTAGEIGYTFASGKPIIAIDASERRYRNLFVTGMITTTVNDVNEIIPAIENIMA